MKIITENTMKIGRMIFTWLLLLNCSEAKASEKVGYLVNLLLVVTPWTIVLDEVGFWFSNNLFFLVLFIWVVTVNMLVGIWFHYKKGTLSVKEFFTKNAEMIAIMLIVYSMLEAINYIAGESLTGEYFAKLIQVLTLLMPISKTFKNIHLITNGKLPPEYIMKKLYNLEKYGDFKKSVEDENN